MKTFGTGRDADVRRALDHEISIIHGAIELVASGMTSRVTCTGLHFTTQLLPDAQAAASDCGVQVKPIWSLDEDAVGLMIERSNGV